MKYLSKISLSRLVFSLIFSIALFYMSKIAFFGEVYKNNYIDIILRSQFKILILIVPIVYFLALLLEKYYKGKYSELITPNKNCNKRLFCLIAFIFLLIIYMVYYLSFYPGGVYIDTWTSYRMLTGQDVFTNQQPVFYTFLLNIVKCFSPNLEIGFAVYTFLQVIFMVSCITYFIYWLLKKNVNPLIVTLITVFFAGFKLYPIYSVSVWKDTPFSLSVFLYAISLIDLIVDFKNRDFKISNIVKFNIFALLSMLLRNNGVYIATLSLFAFIFTLIPSLIKKEKIIHIKVFIITSVITLIVFQVIQCFYSFFGVTMKSLIEESAGIPIQQVARVVITDGNITDDQMEMIEKVLPRELIFKDYYALIVDAIKWDDNFNLEYLEEHKLEYLKLWFELFLQNPGEYVRAYLLQTSGFWSFYVRGEEGYASPKIWESLYSDLSFIDVDLIAKYTHVSFKDELVPTSYYSGGLFFWITFISMFMTYRLSDKKFLLGYLPALTLWLTVMISTPMGSALRYVFVLVLVLPLNVVYPLIAKNLSEKNNTL